MDCNRLVAGRAGRVYRTHMQPGDKPAETGPDSPAESEPGAATRRGSRRWLAMAAAIAGAGTLLAIGLSTAALAGLILAGARLGLGAGASAAVQSLPVEPAETIQIGSSGIWNHDPPASGQHYSTPTGWGVHRRPVPPEYWVGNLERGGIVILYQGGIGSADERSVIDFADRVPAEKEYGEFKYVATQYPGLGHRFALLAWGKLEFLDTWDAGRALDFYRTYVDRGPAQAP